MAFVLSKRVIGLSPVWIAVACVAMLVGGSCGGGESGSSTEPASGDSRPQPGARRTVELYFPGAGGLLRTEAHDVAPDVSPLAQVEEIVSLLLVGPETESLVAPFPPGTELGAINLGPDEVAYVSLDGPSGDGPIAAGSRQELLMLYSLVNSVTLNVDGVSRVALLWNGLQRQTLAGHIDTSRPLDPDRKWIEG